MQGWSAALRTRQRCSRQRCSRQLASLGGGSTRLHELARIVLVGGVAAGGEALGVNQREVLAHGRAVRDLIIV